MPVPTTQRSTCQQAAPACFRPFDTSSASIWDHLRMAGIKLSGEFWHEGPDASRVPGEFWFHPKKGGRLFTHEPLDSQRRHDAAHSYDRIHGELLGRSCLLRNSFETGRTTSEAGPGRWRSNATYLVNSALLMPFDHATDPAVTFEYATASFGGLAEFDGRKVFTHEIPRAEDDWQERLTARDLAPRQVSTPDALYTFHHGIGSRSRNFASETITSSHGLMVTPTVPETLDVILDRLTHMRTLVALSMHQDSRFQGPVTVMPGADDRLRRGETDAQHFAEAYEFHAVWARGYRHAYPFYNRVMSFDDLGPDGIRRWLVLEGPCGHVISALSTLRFARNLSFEDALLRMVAAADSLHRVIANKKKRTEARTMLVELADYAQTPFTNLVPDIDAWAQAVVAERHNAAHNKGLPVQLPALANELVQSVYWVVLLGLLRQAEAPDAAFEAVGGSQPFLWPMKAIAAAFGATNH